jgi:hypothetical protein
LTDVSIDGIQEIKLNFISIRFEDWPGFDCLRIGSVVVNVLRRSSGTFVNNRATISLSRMAVLQILV